MPATLTPPIPHPRAVSARENERQAAVSSGQIPLVTLDKAAAWAQIQREAQELAASEPLIATKLGLAVAMHPSLEKSMAFLLANKLANETLLGTQLVHLFGDAYEDDPTIMDACVTDLQAAFDRDPACETYIQCILFFKGMEGVKERGCWLVGGMDALGFTDVAAYCRLATLSQQMCPFLGRRVPGDPGLQAVALDVEERAENPGACHSEPRRRGVCRWDVSGTCA